MARGRTSGRKGRQTAWRRWAPTAAVLVLVPAFIAAGFWQLDRAGQKRQWQDEYDQRTRAPVLQLDAKPQSADALRFHRVQTQGTYEPDRQVLFENRVHRGRPGYHVITPLRITGSDVRVLVNRGWVPVGPSRDEPPAVETPRGTVTVSGVAMVPSTGGFRLARRDKPPGWQRLWPYFDIPTYRAAVDFPVQPVVILLDPGSAAGGFAREWARLEAGIAVHHGYAFQWFMLALTLLILYAWFDLYPRLRKSSR
jgi:surfeit locus 1 family protein